MRLLKLGGPGEITLTDDLIKGDSMLLNPFAYLGSR